MNFKSQRQLNDFNELSNKNMKLLHIVTLLDNFTQLEFNKEIVVTDVFRTKEEFDALYAATPVEKRPASSPHCTWNAVDLRSNTFTDSEINTMLTFLNCFKNKNNKKVAIYHSIAGNVNHFHLQVF